MVRVFDFRLDWLGVSVTSAGILTLPMLMGRPEGAIAAFCLIALIIAAWIVDPVLLAGGFVAVAALSHWLPAYPDWVPRPAMIWISVAVVHLIRMELRLRERLLRSRAELSAMRKEQQEWCGFLEKIPAGVFITDADGRILMENPECRKLLGIENRPIRGQGIGPILSAVGAALRIERASTLFHVLRGCTGCRPNGEMFVADAWFSIYETPSGTRLGAVVVDASERLQERAHAGLRSSIATSEIAVGAVLHELRNLSGVASSIYSNLAQREPARQADLRKDDPDFEALGRLLKALTTLAGSELRSGEGAKSSVDLTAVLGQLRIIADRWFAESDIQITWDIAPGLPEIFGDESGLLQIFLNLTQNSHRAMLASHNGRLAIQARMEGDWVIVRFQDNGPGVTNADALFQPFRQSTGVKGLGLFVSRAIAHSFHGDLKCTPVESGSCFVVELLPLRRGRQAAVEQTTRLPLASTT